MESPMFRLYRISLTVGFALLTGPFASASGGRFVVLPESHTNVSISRAGESYLDVEFVGWGPHWAWMGWDGRVEENGQAARLVSKAQGTEADAEISLVTTVRQTGPRQIRLQIDLSTTRDTQLTYIVASLAMAERQLRGAVYGPHEPTGPNRISNSHWTRVGLAKVSRNSL